MAAPHTSLSLRLLLLSHSRLYLRILHPSCSSSLRVSRSRSITARQFHKPTAASPPPDSKVFRISEEVHDALQTQKPVVALETTIYTHGWKYPDNIALAARLESLVRVNGGVPATIGVVDGVARVGMREEELIRLCATARDGEEDSRAGKVSRRDLGFIVGMGLNGQPHHGGTTISATALLAHLAGIRIFATGGLGGVHRGGESSLDISADLTELGRTPVAVISSGCKSFLDIPRTLEYLETEGVGVGTFRDGREDAVDFPAFFTRDSGIRSPRVIKDEAEAAAIVHAQFQFPVQSGLLFANPVPVDAALDKAEMDVMIKTAVREAEEKGIQGAANTPYILGRIRELSEGRSVGANRALVESNVARGTKVAVELRKLELKEEAEREHERPNSRSKSPGVAKPVMPSSLSAEPFKEKESTPSAPESAKEYDIVVVGSLISDTISDYTPYASSGSPIVPAPQTSNPSIIKQSPGGVGRNVAVAAHYASGNGSSSSVLLASAVADDLAGTSLLASLKAIGVSTEGVTVLPQSSNARTAQYLAVNDSNKDLHLAMADTSILDHPDLASEEFWSEKLTSISTATSPKWIVMDANWSPEVFATILTVARSLPSKPKIAFEPVSTTKASRLVNALASPSNPEPIYPDRHRLDLISPNALELSSLYSTFQDDSLLSRSSTTSSSWWRLINAFSLPSTGSRSRFEAIAGAELTDLGIPQQSLQLLPYMPCVVTKLGPKGCLVTRIVEPEEACLRDPEEARWILGRAESEEAQTELRVGGVYMRLFPPAEGLRAEEVKGVNGVGDTLLGALIAGLVRKEGRRVEDVVPVAQMAAVMTLKSEEAVGKGVKETQRLLDNLPA